MKKILLILAAAATAVLPSCTEELPGATELTTDDLTGEITIEGFIQYNKKSDDGTSKYVYYEDGTTVNFDVAYSAIDSDASGNYRATAKSDNNGHYKATIKVKANQTVNVTITGSFHADSYGFDVANTKYTLSDANYTFSRTATFTDGNNYQEDFTANIEGYTDQGIINY